MMNFMMSGKRTIGYPVIGLVLGFGAPFGLVLLRWAFGSGPGVFSILRREWAEDPLLYVYLCTSMPLVFALMGWMVARQADRMAEMSFTDALTGVYSRLAFEERMHEEVARHFRTHESLSILVLDIDNLKHINEKLGFRSGNAAVVAVAETMQHVGRSGDVVARLDGDEFAIIAPATTTEDAARLATRLRRRLHELRASSKLIPTLSVGVAGTDSVSEVSTESLVRTATEAMQMAKSQGRDCFVSYSGE